MILLCLIFFDKNKSSYFKSSKFILFDFICLSNYLSIYAYLANYQTYHLAWLTIWTSISVYLAT